MNKETTASEPSLEAGDPSPSGSQGRLHGFLFEGKPVRGGVVQLGAAWRELLERRAQSDSGAYAPELSAMMGELLAAATLLHGTIKFDGALILQIHGDGPVALAVAEVQSDGRVRATAQTREPVLPGANLQQMVNAGGGGRCAITLDPSSRQGGQQPYQGIVPLVDGEGVALETVAAVVAHYMRQSEQLDTRLVLAADAEQAAGLLVQRLPAEANVGGDEADEHFHRIAHLSATLTPAELLTLDVDTLLRRLFWEEAHARYAARSLRFGCACSRDKVSAMLQGLGEAEVQSLVDEQGEALVHCAFCGAAYRYDAVDAVGLFLPAQDAPPTSASVQ